MWFVSDVALREVLREPTAELEQPVSRVVGICLARAEVRLVAVELDGDLQRGVREVDAKSACGHDDLMLSRRLWKTGPSKQLHHLGLEVALSRRDTSPELEDRSQGLHAAPTLPAHLVDVCPQRSCGGEPAEERPFDTLLESVPRHDGPEVDERAPHRGDWDALVRRAVLRGVIDAAVHVHVRVAVVAVWVGCDLDDAGGP